MKQMVHLVRESEGPFISMQGMYFKTVQNDSVSPLSDWFKAI